MKSMRDWERRVLLALLWPVLWLQGKHVRRVTPQMSFRPSVPVISETKGFSMGKDAPASVCW
jgi:hypothetical protein